MPSKQPSKPKSSQQKSARASTLRSDTDPPPTKKLKPLTFGKPPVFSIDPQPAKGQLASKTSLSARKEKGKAKETSLIVANDDQLWVDRYEPQTEDELAVHRKKIEDVRRWFNEAFDGGPSGKLRKYRRILALTGPAGTAKTTTVRVLARELGYEIIEWKNSTGERYDVYGDNDVDSLMEKFQAFLLRASTCRSIFGPASSNANSSFARQIILLEDLPNILHPDTQTQFHEALHLFIKRSTSTGTEAVPVVIVISDAGLRGESGEHTSTGQRSWKTKEVVDIRSVIPPDLLHSPYTTEIRFNPIAPTLMKKGLETLLDAHFHGSKSCRPSKDIVSMIVDSSNGDIRSAVMALQFACVVDIPAEKKGKKKSSSNNHGARVVLESVTRREQSLALFHLIGKVLYNKRKGDHPGASASKKDIERDRILDEGIPDPLKLPPHLKEHERKSSRVNADTLYADTPIDASLFSLYIQQNYTQFCNQVEECDGVSDWLSWVDFSGPEEWFQANPHRFHLLTLGTLHSLPTPVVRRSQKFYKPDFFEQLKNEREGLDGVRDVQDWLARERESTVGRWSKDDIVLELGAILKTQEHSAKPPPPSSHSSFSTLVFDQGPHQLSQLDEDGDGEERNDDDGRFSRQGDSGEAGLGGWLEGDEIEDF